MTLLIQIRSRVLLTTMLLSMATVCASGHCNPVAKISVDLQDAYYQGNADQVLEQIKKLEALTNDSTLSDQKSRCHYYAGLGWRNYASLKSNRVGAYQSALKHLRKAVELDPEMAKAHALLAHVSRSLIGSGQRDHETIQTAIRHRLRAKELADTNPQVMMFEAQALISTPEDRGGDVRRGLSTAFEAVGRFAIAPNEPGDIGPANTWAIIGLAYKKLDDPKRAVKAYENALAARPDWVAIRDSVLPKLKQKLLKK